MPELPQAFDLKRCDWLKGGLSVTVNVMDEATMAVPATKRCMNTLRRYPQDVVADIAPNDPMYLSAPSDLDRRYAGHGRTMLDSIRIAMLAAKKDTTNRILDLPSGHGRVLRLLAAEYPEAELTACDIKPDAVEFCAEKFGAIPVLGREDPREIKLATYDLIWCGSLVTHLDAPLWVQFLDLFEHALEPGGLLVITFSGRHIAKAVEDPKKALFFNMRFGEGDERQRYLRAYEETGFGYSEYPTPPEYRERVSEPARYGVTLAKPWWVIRLLEGRDLRVASLSEGRWGGQDVLGLVKAPIVDPPAFNYTQPLNLN